MKHIINKNFWSSTVMLARVAMREQYKNSFIGIGWSFIQPIMYIVVLAVVFSTIMRFPTRDYLVYVMSGMIPWQFIVTAITRGAASVQTRRGVFHHTVLPKSMFIIADVMVQIYIFLVSIAAAYIFSFFIMGFRPITLLLPFMMIPLMLFCLGGAFMFAYISAYIWDVPHLLNVLFMVLFWTIPIAYPLDAIPVSRRPYFADNPIYLLIRPIQQVMFNGSLPSVGVYSAAMAVAIITLITAYIVFKKLHRNVIYYI